ncbi:hypothetical protein PUMCH_002370 [Australozyma saopauloensis]|uniref:Centromere protein H C-terminal domain-containing protein n=1 Tax=Australozyma saopauloensis TaxID=291208 RepID=A0AAX4H9B8_9ASCO|nr:hypothetical protein PUMCH_002370 [[Candida] saopauloensis]
MTKATRVGNLLAVHEMPGEQSCSQIQQTYVRKLQADLDRTKKFVDQTDEATAQLEDEEDKETRAEEKRDNATEENGQNNQSNDINRKAHLLALYEVYKQLPYLAIKNDLIGIATATKLTAEAVNEQIRTSEQFEKENAAAIEDIESLKTILSDYQKVVTLLQKRLESHPARMAELQNKIIDLDTRKNNLSSLRAKARESSGNAKKVEDLLYVHAQRLIVKLHAMMDWENTSVADESTFRTNILRSSTFLKTLVSNLVSFESTWVSVGKGTSEEHLAKLMIQHGILQERDTQHEGFEGYEVALRRYGY